MPPQQQQSLSSANPRNDRIMDTRTPSPVPRSGSHDSSAEANGTDLSSEVAMLSTKLVNAINYQTNLDDSLQQTRHELEQEQKKSARLAAEKKFLDDMVASGALMRRTEVDKTIARLRAEVATERAAREVAEKAKKQTDGELENLTTALFEEANTMVAAARRDTEAMEKKNSQLKSQIQDTEVLLASQQEQLQDLKHTMERMSERDEAESAARDSSVPSTPISQATALFDALQLSPTAPGSTEIAPDHPLRFSQLLTPVMRTDVHAYTDFQDLLLTARKALPHSRSGSSSTNNLASTSQNQTSTAAPTSTYSGYSPSLPGAFSFSASSSPQSSSQQPIVPPLKESKFYKRAVVEDLEPTLRLDLAPGLSFLSRRSVLSSLLQGTLVVEPFAAHAKFYGPVFACALCGEARKNEPYVRKYRFRTSEEESAQRYPLCDYCLNRVRATGDFVGFLRMVRDGHWRAETEEERKGAWEEATRLRERMFWARLGGGVVPGFVDKVGKDGSVVGMKSVRASVDQSVGADQGVGASPVLVSKDLSTTSEEVEPVAVDAPERRAERPKSGEPVTPPEQTAATTPNEQAEASAQLESDMAASKDANTPIVSAATPTVSEDTSMVNVTTEIAAETSSDPNPETNADVPPTNDESAVEEQSAQTPAETQVPVINEPQSPATATEDDKPVQPKRRPSAIQERIRAMEAKSNSGQSKLPGGFD
ncbi:hypothetical protein MBLNU230_g3119t1 [Neophaeotheca triangularis]